MNNLLRTLAVAAVAALALSGCSNEEYGSCTIPDTKAHKAACGTDGSNSTCVADFAYDCDSMLCGKYEGSDLFCTRRCVPEGCDSALCAWPDGTDYETTCPDGAACVEWVSGSGAYYCLPQDMGCKAGFSYTPGTGKCAD